MQKNIEKQDWNRKQGYTLINLDQIVPPREEEQERRPVIFTHPGFLKLLNHFSKKYVKPLIFFLSFLYFSEIAFIVLLFNLYNYGVVIHVHCFCKHIGHKISVGNLPLYDVSCLTLFHTPLHISQLGSRLMICPFITFTPSRVVR